MVNEKTLYKYIPFTGQQINVTQSIKYVRERLTPYVHSNYASHDTDDRHPLVLPIPQRTTAGCISCGKDNGGSVKGEFNTIRAHKPSRSQNQGGGSCDGTEYTIVH